MSETSEQIAFIKWVRYFYPTHTIFHIPNGRFRKKSDGYILKQMGVIKGVPDLYSMDFHCFIEFKKNNNSKLSIDQFKFKKIAYKTHHKWLIAYGFKHATKIYLNLINSQI